MAPEIFTLVGYNFSVDIWSFGILMYQLVAGEVPFISNLNADIEHQIKFRDFNQRPEFTKDFNNLLEGCL